MRTTRRKFLAHLGNGGVLLTAFGTTPVPTLLGAAAPNPSTDPPARPPAHWYEDGIFLLHLDHHTSDKTAVGSQADPVETDRLIGLVKPDVIQIHAKGRPGWTTYPSKIGHTPPRLARDVLAVWRDIARQRGYAWSIYFNYGRDGEIMKRTPEWNRVDAKGQPRDQMLCYHSGVAEHYLNPMIEEIMELYDPDAFWFDGSVFTVHTCYCAKCRERFRRETSRELPANPSEEGWDAFKEMQRRIYREAIDSTAALIKQHNPKCRVTFNWAYSLHMPEEPPANIDHLTGDDGNEVDYLSLEAHWYDQQPLPFDLMTTGHYQTGNGPLQPKPARQLEQEMAIIIANGGRYHLWDNPTPESGLVPERYEVFGKVVTPFLRSRQKWCLHSTRVPLVSVLCTSTHLYAATRDSVSCFPNGSRLSRAWRGASEALGREHVDYELVSRERLLRQEVKSRFLVAEDLAALQPDEEAALRLYAERGGCLVLTGGSLLRGKLAELAGVAAGAAPTPGTNWKVSTNGVTWNFGMALYPLEPSMAKTTQVVCFAEHLGKTVPLVTRNRFGEGQVVAVMCPVFSLAQPKGTEPPDLEKLRSWLVGQLVPSAERMLTTNAPRTVETVLRKQGNDLVLHLTNRAPGKREVFKTRYFHQRITEIPPVPACTVSLRLDAAPKSVWLQPQNARLDNWNYKEGMLRLELPGFAIHQMAVIAL